MNIKHIEKVLEKHMNNTLKASSGVLKESVSVGQAREVARNANAASRIAETILLGHCHRR